MKRISVAILCLLMAYVSVTAAPITRAQAQQKAAAFMVNRGWVSQESVNNIQQTHRAASAQQRQLTYVFNAPDNKGYVILSGDDCTEPVIGYGEGECFDEATMPENMRGWLANIEEEIQWLQDNNVQMTYVNKIPTHDAIAPLLTSKWGQDRPYNGLCPSGCPSGCLATAVAQVMYYHKWPEQTLEPIPGYTTYTTKKKLNSLPVTTFDWASMKDTYNGETSNAVAKLMQYIGYAVEMDYAPDGSGASERNLPNLVKKYFNYSNTVGLAYRENYSIESWDALVYNELANNRPAVYCGVSTGGGHAFVCDGYDGNGLYHINWGWDGYYNNYFRLSVLNPGTTSTIGSSDTPDGYTMNQTLLYGIKKPADGDQAPETKISLKSLTINGNSISVGFTNIGTYTFGLALEDETNGSFNVLTSGTASGTYIQNGGTYRVAFSALGITQAGTYKIIPVYSISNSSGFRKFNQAQYYVTAEVSSSGSATLTAHPITDLSAENLQFNGSVFANRMCQIDYQLVNNGDEYNGYLYLFATTTSSKGNPLARAVVAADAGEIQDLSFWFVPTTLDDLVIYIATDNKGTNVIGEKRLEPFQLQMIDHKLTYNPLYISVTVQNMGNVDYDKDFTATIYQVGKQAALGSLKLQKVIPAGGTVTYEYTTLNLSNKNTYTMKFSYRKNDYTTTTVDMDSQISIDWIYDDPTALQDLYAEETGTDSWFTPSGVLISQPTAKGIYIRNGKKFVK